MSIKNEMSRVTIDMPKEQHRKLKAKAAILGISLRDIILEAISLSDECIASEHIPNAKTRKAILETKARKGLIRGKKADEALKKLGM